MKNLILFNLIIILFVSCDQIESKEKSEAEINSEILKEFKAMYEAYGNGNENFLSFYQDDFMRIKKNSETQVGKEIPLKEWRGYFNENNTVELLEFTEPTILSGQDQVITINKYDELFISHNTGDTTRNVGTWIGVWKKQPDNTWKIKMDTWHNRHIDKDK